MTVPEVFIAVWGLMGLLGLILFTTEFIAEKKATDGRCLPQEKS